MKKLFYTEEDISLDIRQSELRKNKSKSGFMKAVRKIPNAIKAIAENISHKAKESGKRRRELKRMRRDTAFYYPSEDISWVSVALGMFFRTLTMFMGIFGLLMFWCDAMDIVHLTHYYGVFYVEPGFVALCSLIVSVLAAAASFNRITAAAVPACALTAGIAFIAVNYGNPIMFIWQSVCRFVNYCVAEMVDMGFTSVAGLRLPDNYSYNVNELLNASVALAAVLLGIFFYFTLMKKMRLLPNLLLVGAVLVAVFSYNLTQTNTGFALTLVFVCGAAALRIYDDRFMGGMEKRSAVKKARAEKRERRRETRAEARKEKNALRRRAAAVYNAALEAQSGPDKAKQARKALLSRAADAKRKNKLQQKQKRKAEAVEKKAEKKRLAAELKNRKRSADKAELERIKTADKIKKSENQQARRTKLRSDRRRRAVGGFAAAAAMLVAGLSVWLPAIAFKTKFPVIESIDRPVSYMRRYVTTLLMGDDVDLNGNVYSVDYLLSHNISFRDIVPQENEVFTVDAGDSRNVYLRSWVGVNYDDDVSTWSSFSPSQVVAMKDVFGKNFSSDDITTSFMRYVYPGANAAAEPHMKKTFANHGFVYEHIGVIRRSGASRVLFVPAVSDTEFGVMKYSSLDPTSFPYSPYFDGVYSTRFFDVGEDYSTMSYVPAMNTVGVGDAIDESIKYFNYTIESIRAVEAGADPVAEGESLSLRLSEEGINYTGEGLFDRYLMMSEDEKRELLNTAELEEKYRSYVYSTYLSSSESDRISDLADEISSAQIEGSGGTTDDTSLTQHERVMKVMNFLRSNYSYTLTPGGDDENIADEDSGKTDSGEDDTLVEDTIETGVAEKFLFDVKEGYCSHFATSAVLLLREMGIPARYAEGYIATGFEKSFGAYSSGYKASVKDSAAHAWVEVYFPGRGWITYEATPAYMSDMYDPDSSSPDIYEPDPYVPPANNGNEVTPPSEGTGEFEGDKIPAIVFWIAGALLAALVVAAAVVFVRIKIKKAEKIVFDRHVMITNAMSKEAYLSGKVDPNAAKKINDCIFAVLYAIGCTPAKGELPAAFARRVDGTLGEFSHHTFSEVMEYVQTEEFGHGLDQQSLAILAEYLSDMISSVYAGLSLRRKIYMRYIKHII